MLLCSYQQPGIYLCHMLPSQLQQFFFLNLIRQVVISPDVCVIHWTETWHGLTRYFIWSRLTVVGSKFVPSNRLTISWDLYNRFQPGFKLCIMRAHRLRDTLTIACLI